MGARARAGGVGVRRGSEQQRTNTGVAGRLWALRLALVALLAAACGDDSARQPVPSSAAVVSALSLPSPDTLTISYPAAVSLQDVPLLTNGTLRLSDRVQVLGQEGSPTTIVNLGSGETNLGTDSVVSSVSSVAKTTLRDRMRATGGVLSSSTVELQNDVNVADGVTQNVPIPLSSQTLILPERGPSRGAIQLEPDRSLRLEPGTYDEISVKSRSTLHLQSGIYQLRSLSLEPGSILLLDDNDGYVRLYLTSDFTFRGTVSAADGGFPELVVVTTGSNPIAVDAPFRGTLIAPNARVAFISTSVGHEGAFFGKDLEVQPATPIRHRPLDWETVINGPTKSTLRWVDGSAVLRAATPIAPDGFTDGHVILPELISFQIPWRLRVEQGNAGNFPAQLRFRDPNGSIVTCSYRGGSPTPTPTTGLEVARGLYYEFESCSNGLAAGSHALGKEFWLTIAAVAAQPGGVTLVELHLNGCGGGLEPALEPEVAVELVEGFSWQSTTPVPEFDAQGRLSLYYALIYLEDHEQLGALDDALIHWDPMPLFEAELQAFSGQCGHVRGAFDGEGVFVFALLPGATYNLLRAGALAPADPVTGEDQTIFDVVILRPPPAEAANPDGSVSFDALAESAFLYLDRTELETLDDEQQQPRRRGRFRAWCRKAARSIGNAVRQALRSTVTALGAIHLALGKDCNLHVTTRVLNRDDAFPKGSEMLQAWGADPWLLTPADPNAPAPRAARMSDTKIDLKLWGFGGPFPMLFSGWTNSRGVADLKVPRSDQFAGTAPRGGGGGSKPFCIHLGNEAAAITAFLFYDRVCGFGTTKDLNLRGSTREVEIVTTNKRVHMYSALLDAHRYLDKVADYTPHRVQVLTGGLASKTGTTPFASCMGLAAVDDAVGAGAAAIVTALTAPVPPITDALALAFSQSDIVMPDNSASNRDSRGIIVHEYGHFSLCSMIYDASPLAMTKFMWDRINQGKQIQADQDVAILSDAFADFVAMQVVGGVSYPNPSGARGSHGMSYCVLEKSLDPCFEGNADGTDGSGDFEIMAGGVSATAEALRELARVGTTWHDAFDGDFALGTPRLWDVPGSADYYVFVPGTGSSTRQLQPSTNAWSMLPGALRHDENVHLPGSAMAAWIARMVNDEEVTVPGSVTVSVSATVPGSMRALAATMYEDHGISWCDACQLFALHEPGVIPYPPAWLPTTPGEVANVWAACGQGRLAEYVGAPPEPQLNMRTADCSVCPPRSYLELSTGDCVDCPPGQVPATWSCVPCPAATYAAADGTCQPCPTNHISVRGVCVPCGHVETVDYATNSCVACAPDVELDLRDVAAACDPATVTMERAAHPGDNCPDRLVVRVTGVMEVGSGLTTELATYWDPDDQGPGACTDDRAGFSLVDASGNEWSYRRSGGTYNEFVSQEYCYLIADGTEYCVDTIQTDPSCRWPSFRDLRGPNTATLMIEPPASPRVVFELRPLVWPAACEVELR